jgi:anti-anti-sigma regulatory factor
LLSISVTSRDAGVIVVTMLGVLSYATVPRVRATLLKCLAEQPTSVVVDLDLVAIQHVAALNVFAVVAREASVWSGTQVILVAGVALDSRLKPRLRTLARFVRICPTMNLALAAAWRRPIRSLSVRTLAGHPAAAAAARHHVREVCERWGCANLAEDATLVADEIVSHVVVSSGIDSILKLELRRGLLTVSVTAGQAPRAGPSPPLSESANQIVSTLAAARGSTPAQNGGTVTWVVLRDPSGSQH